MKSHSIGIENKDTVNRIIENNLDICPYQSFTHFLKESKASPSGRGRQKVRFYDEVTQLP